MFPTLRAPRGDGPTPGGLAGGNHSAGDLGRGNHSAGSVAPVEQPLGRLPGPPGEPAVLVA